MTQYDDHIERFLDKAALELMTEAEKEAPRDTQALAGDITVFPITTKGERSVGNTALIDYAKYVYYGTQPHVIRPKKKKALKTPYGVFKKINHPGTKANPYLDRALENIVRSGKFLNLLDGFADDMSEEMFANISDGLKNLKVG